MNSDLSAALVGAAVTIVVTLLGLLPLYRQSLRKKEEAEAESAQASTIREILEGAQLLVDQSKQAHLDLKESREVVKELETVLRKRDETIVEYSSLLKEIWNGSRKLVHQLKSRDIKPVYIPPSDINKVLDK